MNIAIDIDGCLANFTDSYATLLIAPPNRDLLPAGWECDPDFPSTWNWHFAAGYTPEEDAKIWDIILKPETEFWRGLTPLNHAQAALHVLNMAAVRHNIYFVTTRPGASAKLQTEQWLHYHGMDYPTVIISTGSKLPIVQALGVELFIDDKPETLLECNVVPTIRMYGKRQPYNRHLEGRVRMVDSVLEMLDTEGI